MFNIFSSKKDPQLPEGLYDEVVALKQRWDNFLLKMEERYREVVTAGIPEMEALHNDQEDPYQRAYYQFSSGWKGQLNTIIKKAQDTYQVQPLAFYNTQSDLHDDNDLATNLLDEFRDDAHDKLMDWEKRLYTLQEDTIKAIEVRDWEAYYQQVLDNYNKIRDQFSCKQCGAKLEIPKIFFISTYITCSHCQTQNTFEPGSEARSLETNARNIAESRCTQLYADYETVIYKEPHSRVGIEVWRANKQIEVAAYEKYLRGVFGEMHKIVPELTAEHDRFCERLLNEYRERNL